MPATLYLRPSPRAYFLITDTHALVFRQPDSTESKAARSVVVAEFLNVDEIDRDGLILASRGRTVEGVLGVTSVPSDRSPVPEIFLLLVSTSTSLPPLIPSSSLRPRKVTSVEFHSLSSSFWDPPNLLPTSVSSSDFSQYPFESDLDDRYGPHGAGSGYSTPPSATQSQAAAQGIEHPCNGMRKYLESGSFFFAERCAWDISTRMGETNWIQAEKSAPKSRGLNPLESYDDRFVWNTSLLKPLLTFRAGLTQDMRIALDEQALILPVIQGFVGSTAISSGSWKDDGTPELAALGMISRLSWKRAGVRFRTRGIDDDGNVANFVETETILAVAGVCYSYVEVRGSVPLFWSQPESGLQTLQQKVQITRPAEATQPAFDKHFLDLLEHYHAVHAVNLLGQKDAESMLSDAYSSHLKTLKGTLESTPSSELKTIHPGLGKMLSLTPYDFHAAVKIGGHDSVKFDFESRLPEIMDSMEDFGWTAIDASTGQIVETQQGVFRVNCLDCLDRTNYVQDVISSITLSRFLTSLGLPLIQSSTLWAAHRELWADNGDRLSKIYAGTGALNTSATRSGKKTFAGLLSDATKSVGRAYINNFQDKGKQTAIDMLLGMMAGQRQVILFDPISDTVQSALNSRINEYSSTKNITIFSGTWNLNGKAPSEALDSWLFPPNTVEADIYAIAFQEIVELTAQQILQTDPAKRRMWETYIKDTFSQRKGRTSEYLLLRSEQLVGTALIIMIKSSLATSIRSVEAATKKTGLQGLSGNKGGVGIRMNIFDSSLCLMTCHLAAGHGNVEERNADYRTISHGMKFPKGKTIDDHDIVIWGADFNYRINLPNLDVREFAEGHRLDDLFAADQLVHAMGDAEVFVGYEEGPITFSPTYKYDNGSDEYDTSEKQRIPAWTDRILFKGSQLRLKDYNRAELRTSDHRPVYAIFDATMREVDHKKKDEILKELSQKLRPKTTEGALDNVAVPNVASSLTKMVSTKVSSAPPATNGAYKASPRLPPRPYAPPSRPSSASPSVSSINGQKKGSPPPVPSRARAISNGTPVLTPSATGDFVLVSPVSSNGSQPNGPKTSTTSPATVIGKAPIRRTAPPLPPRVVPSPKNSLDINSSPPDGLPSPVTPDQVSLQNVTSSMKVKAPPPPLPAKPLNLKSRSFIDP